MRTTQHHPSFCRPGPAAVAPSDPVTRRQLLGAAGLGIGTLAIGGRITSVSAASPADSTIQRVAGPARSGTLAAALGHVFLGLDPTTGDSFGTIALNNLIYEPLYRIDPFPPGIELSPRLAAELPQEIDPTTYRVPLRDDIAFHDGTPLTADDVVFTIERIKDPATASVFAPYFGVIDTAEVVDDHTVELRLTSPTTLLASRLVLIRVLSRLAVEGSDDALELNPVGTGPYRLVSAVSNESVSLEAFDEYTGPRPATFDGLDIGIVTDANARISGLQSGRWAVIEDVPASAFDALGSTEGLIAEAVPSTATTILAFNCGMPPFDDPRVRQAVAYGIDRDTITTTAFFGQAEPAWDGYVRADNPDHAQPPTQYRYDPGESRRLLGEAGYGPDDSIPIRLLLPTTPEFLASQGPVVEQNLTDLGFEPDVITGELQSLLTYVSDGTFGIFLSVIDASALGATDAEFLMRYVYYGTIPSELLRWSGEPFDEMQRLLDEALAAPDDDARRAALADAQEIAQREVPFAPLHRKQQLTAWSDRLDGFRPLPTVGFLFDGVSG